MVAVRVEPLAPSSTNGVHLTAVEPAPDILVNYLPGILRQDPFLLRLLRLFDSMWRPLLEIVDSVDAYLDPALTTPALVDWLGIWVGVRLQPNMPEKSRRALVKEAVALHRERGTADGVRHALALLTGQEPLLIENTPGLRLDGDARLGLNTTLEKREPFTIHITFPAGEPVSDLAAVLELVREMKPAHATCVLHSLDGTSTTNGRS